MPLIIGYSIISFCALFSILLKNRKSVFVFFFRYILSFCTVFYSLYFIEWTVDKYNYEIMLLNIDDYSTDFLFTKIAEYALIYNHGYDNVYLFHIIIEAFLLSLFINKYTNRPFFVLSIFMMLNIVNVANQLRFFLGFAMFLYAISIYNKNKIFYYILGITAVLSHASLIICFLYVPIRKVLLKINIKTYLILFIFIFISIPIMQIVVSIILPQFTKYFESSNTSSWLGGVFTIFPVLLFVFRIMFINEKLVKKHNVIVLNEKYKFLFSLSLFSFLFMPLSIYYHVFAHRFLFTFNMIWTCFLLKVNFEVPKSLLYISRREILMLNLFLIVWFYYATELLLDYNYYLDNLKVMLGVKISLE